ncbi:VOC family protein [Herbiconiux sp. 11R-BC]|uniref:VOC family protein n=1 Tax=Herbiconiux sp. 11R-BC TaxID=3111637 RepID=UPI003C0EDA4F
MPQKISPFLWFDTEAEQAAEFYVSLFDDSRIVSVSRYPEGGPMPAGQALGVSFVLEGLEFQALNGGPGHPFTDAVSLFTRAETQAEIDRLWDALTADGGEPGPCGWLTDRFGLKWQIVPPLLAELLADPDPAKAAATLDAMMRMSKLDLAALQAAHDAA